MDEFNANPSKFIKFVNKNGKHNTMVLKPGLNVDPNPFQTDRECSPGGIYFTKEDYLWKWYNDAHMYVCDVFIPENARVHTESNHKIKADQVILSEFIKIDDYVNQLSNEAQLSAVQQNGDAIKYIKSPSEEVQLAAVRQYGWVIKFIESPSKKVQLAAVQYNGCVIERITSPSEEVQLAAVCQCWDALQCIESPSEEVQMVAVQQNGLSIRYINSPSEKVQLAAGQYA